MFKLRLNLYDRMGYPIKGGRSLIVRFLRFFSIPIARFLSRFHFSPEIIVFISFLFGLAAGFCFYAGTSGFARLGAILLLVAWILDCVDGDLARMQKKITRFGEIIDSINGRLLAVILFSSISLVLFRNSNEEVFLIMGMAIISTYLIFTTMESKVKIFKLQDRFVNSPRSGEERFIEKGIARLVISDLVSGYNLLLLSIIIGGLTNKMESFFVFCFFYSFFYMFFSGYNSFKKSLSIDQEAHRNEN